MNHRRAATTLGLLAATVLAGCTTGKDAVPAGSDADGCPRPYADASPWNTPIGAAPRYDGRSARYVAALQGKLSSDPTQYTYPVYRVTAETAREKVSVSGWFSNVVGDGRRLELQRSGAVEIPIPAGARAAAGSDAQIVILDPATGDEWGAWQLERDPGGGWRAANAYRYNTRWSGVPPYSADGRPFFSRGGGLPYLAGLVRPCEIARGRIEHALAFAYNWPRRAFVYPATKSDGLSTDPDYLPHGARLQLDPTLTPARLRERGCFGPCLTIARALQEYGMYVVDNSGRPKIMVEYEGTAAWEGLVTASTVSPIPLSAFKVVSLGRSEPPPIPRKCTVVGTAGDDVIYGTRGRDVICAGHGDDVVYGLGGNDVIFGGRGDDVILGGRSDDVIFGGFGRDRLRGGPGNDRISGGDGADLLMGGHGHDRLVGGRGRDRMLGGPGRDTLVARDGRRDVVDGGRGRDRARVDAGLDVVRRVQSRF